MKKLLLLLSLFTLFILSSHAQAVYVSENFNGAALPTGWTNNAVTGTHVWEFGLDGSVDHPGNNNIDGTAMAFFDDSKNLSASKSDFTELITPAFNNVGSPVTTLEFDYNFRHLTGNNDSLIVEVFDGTSWHLVFSVVTDNCGNYLGTCVSGGFPHAAVSIGAYANAACKVRFRYFDGNDWGWYAAIDNVLISSPLPNDIQVSRVSSPFSGCGLTNSETVTAVIKNIGSLTASNFNVAYTINNGTPVSESVASSIAAGDSLIYAFTTKANLSTVNIYNIKAYTIFSTDGNTSNDTSRRVVANEQVYATPYFEDFELSDGGWKVSGSNPSWQHGFPNYGVIYSAYSGQKAFVTNLTGPYNNSELSYLTSPCYNFSALIGDPILNFAFIYKTEAPYDRFWMESSKDNGATWSKILATGNPTNWYSSTSTKTWQGVKSSWVAVENILSGLAGQSQVKLRFVFSSDGSTNLEGLGVDNISIRAPQANDLSLRNFVAPNAAGQPLCGFGNEHIVVQVENKGVNSIVNPVMGFRVDNGAVVTETFNTTIAPNVIKTYTFTATHNFSAKRNYRVDVWGTAANDIFNVNDSLLSQTVVNATSNAKTLSYSDNFESFTDGSCSSSSGDIYTGGWYVNTGSGYAWHVQNSATCPGGSGSSTPDANTGPAGDHTTGNGKFVYTEASYSGGPAELILPCVDLSNVNGAVLRFWYHKYGANMGNLFVDVRNGSGNWINNIGFVPGQTHTSSTDPWKEKSVSLSQFIGQNIYIRFRAIRGNGVAGDMAIDDIVVYEPLPQDAKVDSLISPESGCDLTPNELVCVNVENFGTQDINNMTVGYSINGGAPVYETKSGILIIPGAKLKFCLNLNRANLAAPGRYNFKIWSDLIGDSNRNNDTLFQTVINETILFPSCEDFSNLTDNVGKSGEDLLNGKFSNNWVSNQGPYSWEYTANGAPGPSNDHTPTGPTRYMAVDPNNGNPGNIAILTSPCYDLTTVAVANLEFWYHVYGGSAQNTMFIDLFDGNLWQNRIDSIKGQPQANAGSPWMLKRISLANYTGNFVNLRFRAYKSGATYSLDDICMVPPPPDQAQMERILRPLKEQCFYSNAEIVRIRMKNIGSNNLDSLQVRLKVDTSKVGGANSGLLLDSTVWVSAGNIPPWTPGKLFTYDLPIPVNMSFYKEYNISAELFLQGDLDAADNKIVDYKVVHKAPIQFPYVDGFETIPYNSPGPNYNNGFKRDNNKYKWRIKRGMDRQGSTGPAVDHTRGNSLGNYFVTNSADGKVGEVAILESPCFDMSQLNKPSLRYWYHMFGADMGELYVDINADNGWVPVDTIAGQQQINNISPWKKASIDLQAYAGQYAKVRFRSVRGDGSSSNMAIDDLFLYDLSRYDVGPTALVLPGNNNYSCYSDTQSVHVKLLNYGAKNLDFTVDSIMVTVDILKNGVAHASLFRNLNTNIFFNANGAKITALPSDSSIVVWVNNSLSGSSTFDMSDVGATYTFNIHTSSPRDSVSNNDNLTKNITTQIAGGNVVISNNSICNGSVVTLTASNFYGAPKWERKYFGSGGSTYWLPEFGFGSDSAKYTVQPDTTAWYRIRVCQSDIVSDSVLINVTVVKIPDAINDTICGGGQMTVEGYAAPVHNLKAVNWYHNKEDETPFKVTTSAPFTHTDNFIVSDTFWLEGVIDSCVSMGRNAVYAVVNPYPVIDLGQLNDTLCQDTNRVLNGGAGFGFAYDWRIWGPAGFNETSHLQTIGVNPLRLEKDSTYNYQVTVTSNFNCVTISPQISIRITDSCFVGIEEPLLAKQFELYPNPTNDRINIKFSGDYSINADIQIQSMEGKQVWSKRNIPISKSNYEIDLSGVSEGIYLVRIRTENEIIVKKLIKN